MSPRTVNATIVSQEQLSNAVSRFGAFDALRRVGHFDMDLRADAPDPFSVELEVGGEPLAAHVVAILGSGALLEFSQKTDSTDSEVHAMYFAVRQVHEPGTTTGVWEISPDARFGDGSINDYNAAALAAAKYVYG